MKRLINMLVPAVLAAAAVVNLNAQSYYLAGEYNGWSPGSDPMSGGPTVYSYTITNGTPAALHYFKVTVGDWSSSWPGGNARARYDAGGTNTIYFYPGTIADGWLPVANRVGYADPGNVSWEIIGAFNGWDQSQPANAQMTSQGNGLYAVDYVITNVGTYEFKFRTPGSWSDLFMGATFENGGANASVTTTTAMQTVRFQLDLPNGRWLAGAPAPAPVTNDVTFQVDMTAQIIMGAFIPGIGTIRVTGPFSSWGDGIDLTNNPTLSGNASNIYSMVVQFIDLADTLVPYKFRMNGGWENPASTGGQNRTFNLGSGPTQVLPLVYYNDASPCDLLAQDTTVTFRLHLTNGTVALDGTVFDRATMEAKINGAFNSWNGNNWDATLPTMVNTPPGSDYFEYTTVLPRGASVAQAFKFGIYQPYVTVNVDNELPPYQDHIQYVRTLGASYAMPYAEFGTNYAATRVESSFGDLKVGAPSGGAVPITWLGRPCVTLQVRSSLAGGSWQDIPTTDSEQYTNWPLSTGSSQFFRLQKRNIP
jgi:hypothetical protein